MPAKHATKQPTKKNGFRLPKDVNGYSERGARLLAAGIKDYWKRVGFAVQVETFQVWRGAFGVRSNLVNGLPPGYVA